MLRARLSPIVRFVAGVLLLAAGTSSAFTDLTAGKRLVAKGGADPVGAKLSFKFAGDPNLATLESPLCPAETSLRIVSDAAVGTATDLDCAYWSGGVSGYRYVDQPVGPGSLRKIVYKQGRLIVKLRGEPYASEGLVGPRTFIETRVTIGTRDFCARWAEPPGDLVRNEPDRITARGPTAPCQVVCGNGVLELPEACDDVNATDGDGCDSNCRPTGCGNGVVTSGEACDDGNLAPGDGCRADCTPELCGDGIVDAQEGCDDGNLRDDDCCSTACMVGAPGSPCTDRDGCTTGDTCQVGVCVGTPRAPWINEFDYDDFAALNDDRDEFVEIAGPAGTDVGGYKVVAVEGADGSCATPLGSTPGNANVSGTIPSGTVLGDDTGTGIGFLVACFSWTSSFVPGCDVVFSGSFTDSNLQNGHLTNADLFSCPDGILLLDAGNDYVDSVSYEGTVPNLGFFGPYFHLLPPYTAERDEGWAPGVSIEKRTSTLARAAAASEWRDPSELGNIFCQGQLGLACPTNTRTPGVENPLQNMACGSPSAAFVDGAGPWHQQETLW